MSYKIKPTYISLFSSAGVGCYGFKMEGFDCIATNELIEKRLDVQKANDKCKYSNGYICGDITKDETKKILFDVVDLWKQKEINKNVDVIVATPPCQGMSTANYKKNSNEIVRNSLVVEAIEIIEKLNPSVFVFENVKAFIKTQCVDSDDEIMTIGDCITKHLEKEYYIYHRVINFKDYGVPSSRPRTIVVGTKRIMKNISPLNIFPLSRNTITLKDAIGDLKRLEYGEIDENDIYHSFREYPKYMQEWISGIKEGESAFDESNPVKPYKIENGIKVELKGSYMGNKFRRMYWNQPAPCIATRNDQLASQSTIHPSDDRVLSIRELMKVMTIPEMFKWTDEDVLLFDTKEKKKEFLKKNELNIRRSIGEAVPTEIMRTIAHNIKEMLCFESYVNCGDSKYGDIKENFYVKTFEIENGLKNTKETGSFYTPQSVVFDTIKNYEFSSDIINILEPSVGMGAFLPQIFRLVGEIDNVNLDLVDLDKNVIDKLKKMIKLIGYTKDNLKIKYINADFLTLKIKKKYDLIISNPPFVRYDAKQLSKYRDLYLDKTITNSFAFFMYKYSELSDEIALLIPKMFLMTPEFNELRKLYEGYKIVSIVDYGVNYFKSVFIEIISIHFKKNYFGSVMVEDKRNSHTTKLKQGYIYHDKSWLIYRNEWFDEYISNMELDIFDFYRDRQITNKYLKNKGKYRVLRSKNILDNGDIVSKINYDKYIDNIDSFKIKDYLNSESIIMTNFTYNTRATILPKNTIVNGSIAILVPKEKNKKNIDLKLYATDDFRKYYAIVKNNSKFTLNIDSNSIYYIGVVSND